ncbi:hypothetical protein T265_06306 [Opisthorchis viverrini]|uniref:Hydroxymethylglutaryl-CoA synthase n=2 Tax=Opisthorchis viverrini TaxID=6198 RepID=A0A074ZSU0_OPIVI|nr:hypothetical protein T265_06306 [Opisthorchis viverrini]KER26450.1 hypothetical protein T265_06306 [Opisthorchis viverrini]
MSAQDFGILALEVYFPRYYISQSDLEVADGCPGKYVTGLEQESLGFCTIEEDISSICLTAVSNLVRRLNLDLLNVGFMEVGTETLIDKSKSTKTVLMQLFEACGNFDVEGIDVKNACFGGTAALFHALNWLESSAWDGRLALVVAGDIAIYGSKAARPTGGAGAVAILLGPNAPLVIDPGLRSHHVQHKYDFYKPDMSSEYPTVDGHLSLQCYRDALIQCYRKYKRRVWTKNQLPVVVSAPLQKPGLSSLHNIDYLCFHSPFTRLVRKAYGWLVMDDMLALHPGPLFPDKEATTNGSVVGDSIAENGTNNLAATIDDQVRTAFTTIINGVGADSAKQSTRDVDIRCMEATRSLFSMKVEHSLVFAKHVGNMYTASLYGCLASLLFSVPDLELRNRRILMYSYGSGLAAAMFSLTVHPSRPLVNVVGSTASPDRKQNSVFNRLFNQRTRLQVSEFEKILNERRSSHNAAPFKPPHNPGGLFPGSYFLTEVDESHRRTYEILPSQHIFIRLCLFL